MDEVLVDNMEHDLSVWDHTEDDDEAMNDVSLQVPAVTESRRYRYHTSHFTGIFNHPPSTGPTSNQYVINDELAC